MIFALFTNKTATYLLTCWLRGVTKKAATNQDHKLQTRLSEDPKQSRKWVMLVDGHPHQINQIKQVMKGFKVKAVLIQDFIHVLAYLMILTRLSIRVLTMTTKFFGHYNFKVGFLMNNFDFSILNFNLDKTFLQYSVK